MSQIKTKYGLKKILGNLRVPLCTKAAHETTRQESKTSTPEPLTKKSLKRILGAHYGNVVVYNIEKNKLSPKIYHWHKVYWPKDIIRKVKVATAWIKTNIPGIEPIAQVSGQVTEKYYPGWTKWTDENAEIEFDKFGEFTIFTYIVRDTATGEFGLLHNGWLGGGDHWFADLAAKRGAYCVLSHCITCAGIQQSMRNGRAGR